MGPWESVPATPQGAAPVSYVALVRPILNYFNVQASPAGFLFVILVAMTNGRDLAS